MATLIASAIRQFADPTVLAPLLVAFVLWIILFSVTWRYGGWVALGIASIMAYAGYKGMRMAACRGYLGPAVASKCAMYGAKRAAAQAAAATASNVATGVGHRVGQIFWRQPAEQKGGAWHQIALG